MSCLSAIFATKKKKIVFEVIVTVLYTNDKTLYVKEGPELDWPTFSCSVDFHLYLRKKKKFEWK